MTVPETWSNRGVCLSDALVSIRVSGVSLTRSSYGVSLLAPFFSAHVDT